MWAERSTKEENSAKQTIEFRPHRPRDIYRSRADGRIVVYVFTVSGLFPRRDPPGRSHVHICALNSSLHPLLQHQVPVEEDGKQTDDLETTRAQRGKVPGTVPFLLG